MTAPASQRAVAIRACASAHWRCSPSASRCMPPACAWATASRRAQLTTELRTRAPVQHLHHRHGVPARHSRLPRREAGRVRRAGAVLLAQARAADRRASPAVGFRVLPSQGTYFTLVDYWRGASCWRAWMTRPPQRAAGGGGRRIDTAGAVLPRTGASTACCACVSPSRTPPWRGPASGCARCGDRLAA